MHVDEVIYIKRLLYNNQFFSIVDQGLAFPTVSAEIT